MKRIGLLLLLAAFVFSLSPGFAQNDNAIVRFGDLHGEVNVRQNSEDDDAYIFAELKTPLKHDDRIRTLPKSGAILSFSDMTTFVMKEDTVIVLDIANERESKVGLVAGKVWVNLKKMVADGSMEVEMAQAVAGIKGTNITCSSDLQAQEDRVAVMRGHANVRVKETGEEFTVEEGEELVIKKDAKPEKLEIDVQAEQSKWEEDLSRLGESLDINDLPEIFRNINESSAAEFSKLNEIFQNLMAQEKVELADAVSLRTSAERFVGVIMENLLVLNNSKRRIDVAMETEGLSDEQRAQLNSLVREMAASIAAQNSFQAEAARMMRYQFRTSAVSEEFQSELEMIRTELAQIVSDLDSIRAILSSNSAEQTQDWFIESADVCNQAQIDLSDLSQRVTIILLEEPDNLEAQALLKSIADQQTSVATMLKSLIVVEVDTSTITEMQQIEYEISEAIVTLEQGIRDYNSISSVSPVSAAISRQTVEAQEARLKASIAIMSNFANARKLYTKAQRKYDSTMRSTAGSAARTSEQEEMDSLWMNISDRFQQLGVVAEELQQHIQELEDDLNHMLNR
ncbi:MAG: hypothetical protein A2W80_09070 [Candidatus Riflebacteria bacterium GWC2_50_8]|nr:MAG: hypothetical protein A2W80_09070 [Candidatus Riflebacteria bacterium GWC2_50_8]